MSEWGIFICMVVYYLVIMHEFSEIRAMLKQIKIELESKP